MTVMAAAGNKILTVFQINKRCNKTTKPLTKISSWD